MVPDFRGNNQLHTPIMNFFKRPGDKQLIREMQAIRGFQLQKLVAVQTGAVQ